MNNKLLIFTASVISIIIAGLIITFVYLYATALGIQGNASARNIEHSKKINAYKGQYIIDSLSSDLEQKLRSDSVDLGEVEIWIEQVWHTRTKYVFFHPIQFEQGYQLISKNITNRTCSACEKKYKLACEKIKNEDYFNFSVEKEMCYYKSIPKYVHIYVYQLPADAPSLIGVMRAKLIW